MAVTEPASRLVPNALQPLRLGEIRPRGWLRAQLQVQAEGLSGHLDEFWPDVARSGWIGGDAEGWERGPYWLDGIVPLAFLLDDAELKRKVQFWVTYILEHQAADGWLGPVQDEHYGYRYDPWPVFVTLKALTQYEDATRDERVVPAIGRFLQRLSFILDEQPLRSWGWMRWADLMLSIFWLYERTHESWLLDLAEKVQAQGFDWGAHFASFPYQARTVPEQQNLESHVVNNAMAIKAPAVWSRQSRETFDREGIYRIVSELDSWHGQATGAFSGDEHLAGRNPSQGTELCAVVEYMFSMEVGLSVLGDAQFGDRLESLAYNALPATLKPDMWAHQYDQQVNQVVCRLADERVYTSNGPDSNIYGLEPNFGCCTANMHQGWPKFASSLWMHTPDGGLAAVAYAPCEVDTHVNGKHVRLQLDTEYPFGEFLEITVYTEEPASFPLYLRVPKWATEAEVRVDEEATVQITAEGFHRIDRQWEGQTPVRLLLPMTVRTERRYNDAISIYRGPLLYALEIGEEWKLLRGEPPHADWEVFPTTPWNYALLLDEEHPEKFVHFEVRGLRGAPFSPEAAPVRAEVKGRKVPEWQLERNAAAPPPHSPVHSTAPLEELTLLPYGCTNLRIGEVPTLEG